MGLISALFSRTGVGKYIAAKNAIVAKYTFESLETDVQKEVDAKILSLLIVGFTPSGDAEAFKSRLRETQYFGMAALAMGELNISPKLSGLLFRDWWEFIRNPLIALTGAEKEIKMATDEILRRHNVIITLNDDLFKTT